MEVDFFRDPSCFPPLPDDLDELFSDDLLQFLNTAEFTVDPNVVVPVNVQAAPAQAAPAPVVSDGAASSGSLSDCAASIRAPLLAPRPAATGPSKATSAAAAKALSARGLGSKPMAKGLGAGEFIVESLLFCGCLEVAVDVCFESEKRILTRYTLLKYAGIGRTVTTEAPPKNPRIKKEQPSPAVSVHMDSDTDDDSMGSNQSDDDNLNVEAKVNKRKVRIRPLFMALVICTIRCRTSLCLVGCITSKTQEVSRHLSNCHSAVSFNTHKSPSNLLIWSQLVESFDSFCLHEIVYIDAPFKQCFCYLLQAPEIDWRAIEDPAERRRQRRLAKNRVTAARSRERKKVQWADMEVKLQSLEQDNANLKALVERFAKENSSLRDQLANLAQGSSVPAAVRGSSTEPAVLVFIATLLLLCSLLPSEQALALGGCVPLVLLAQLLRNNSNSAFPLSDHLLRFIACLKLLVKKSAKGIKRGIDRILFERHHYLQKVTMSKIAQAGVYSAACMPRAQSMMRQLLH